MATTGETEPPYGMAEVRERVQKGINVRRRAADLSQVELAQALGVPQGYVSDWERGKWIPNLATLWDMTRVMKCSLDDLAGPPKPKEQKAKPSSG